MRQHRRRWLWELARERAGQKRRSCRPCKSCSPISPLEMEDHGHSPMDEVKTVDSTFEGVDDTAVQVGEQPGRLNANNASRLKPSRQQVYPASSKMPRYFLTAALILLQTLPLAGLAPVAQTATGPRATVWCVECEDVAASVFCENCKDHFCGLCYQWQHRSGNRASHSSKPLPGTKLVT